MKISCVIPAYNEEKTIADVVKNVKDSQIFHEIIIISDGSTDQTSEIARNIDGVHLIDLEKNIGKGGAVWHGFQKAEGDIIAMLDADLIGIRGEHIQKIIDPIINKESDVCIGIITHKKRAWMSIVQTAASNLSGQQAFWRHLIQDADIQNTRFGVEIALKNHFKKKGAKTKKVLLHGVEHLMKEQKMGLEEGLKHRGKMYKEVGKEISNDLKKKLKKKKK